MPYSLSVWLDDDTASALEKLVQAEERKRSDMVRVLIRRAARASRITGNANDGQKLGKGKSNDRESFPT